MFTVFEEASLVSWLEEMASEECQTAELSETSDPGEFAKPWKSSDLVLSVENRKFHVHRTLLAVASPVFERMFSSDFKEKNACEIPLPGKKAGEIEELLKFIYPDQVFTLTRKNCLTLFRLANEYQIERLEDQCNTFISNWSEDGEMTAQSALMVVAYSQNYPLNEDTVDRCLRIFSSREDMTWDDIKRQKLFQRLKPETVQRVMEKRIKYFEDELGVRSSTNNLPRLLAKRRKVL